MPRLVGLVSSIDRHSIARAVSSLSDCDDVIVVHDAERRGQAWARNALTSRAPAGSIVRFADDDDVAMSTRRMADRLIASGADVMAASFISGAVRETVPEDALAAAIDSVGPWSWVAHVDALRAIPWAPERTQSTGTWHWLAMMDAGLRFAFAPDIWGYHWVAEPSGVTRTSSPDGALIDDLRARIEASGRFELFLPLMARARRAGLPVDVPRLEGIGARFKRTFGRYPDIRSPRTFSERVAARKALEVDTPIFATWCDKLSARAWAADRLGIDMAPRLLYAGDELPDDLPSRFYAKANHGSGWGFAYDAGAPDADVSAARVAMQGWINTGYGMDRAEEAYAAARRMILIEEFLPEVREVRAFVFGGRVGVISCERGFRTPLHCLDFYDRDNRWIDARQVHRNNPAATMAKDASKAIEIAETLGRGFDFVRVDLLEADGRLYFGEMTPFPYGGNVPMTAWLDDFLGDLWGGAAAPLTDSRSQPRIAD
jgi:hypothetical protein